MFAIGRCQGAVQGAVQADPGCSRSCLPWCCPGCSGSPLLLGGVRLLRVLCRVLSRVLRIMFAIGWCQNCPGCSPGCSPKCSPGCSGSCLPLGGVRVLSRVLCRFRVLRIMFAMVLSSGGVQGATDHVCYWAVSGCCWGCCAGCCPGCSGSCLRLGGVRTVQGALQGAFQSALQGAPDHVCHWVVSGCCSHGFVG